MPSRCHVRGLRCCVHSIHLLVPEDYSDRTGSTSVPWLHGVGTVPQLSHCACRDGNTPLHLACQCNQLSTIEVLLQWGARAEMTNASGFAPVSHSSALPWAGDGASWRELQPCLSRMHTICAKSGRPSRACPCIQSCGAVLHFSCSLGSQSMARHALAASSAFDSSQPSVAGIV